MLKTSELTGAALDWAVNKAGGMGYEPSRDWAEGGPIIEREGINLNKSFDGWWASYKPSVHETHGPTPLIAAMRCYVASQLGDEVDVPLECLIYETDDDRS